MRGPPKHHGIRPIYHPRPPMYRGRIGPPYRRPMGMGMEMAMVSGMMAGAMIASSANRQRYYYPPP